MTRPELFPEVRSVLDAPPRLFIGGRWHERTEEQSLPSLDPATGLTHAWIARGTVEDVDAAVQAASQALAGEWSRLSPDARGEILWRTGDLITQHAEPLAQLEALDSGKPIVPTRDGDIPGTAEVFRYYAGWPTKIAGATRELTIAHTLGMTLRQPVGVVGMIVPWNFPLLMTAWKLAPALAAGCTMVLKPSEFTSLSALYLADLLREAGVPNGVVNVVTGVGSEAGEAIVRHPGIDKVAFTGSTAVGRAVMRGAADSNLKNIALELGGKSPNIVFDDADLSRAIEVVSRGIFGNMGQNCTAGSRILVQRGIYAEVVEALGRHAESLVLGDSLQESTQIGPLVNVTQRARVSGYVDLAEQEGARIITDRSIDPGLSPDGYYLRPAVIADASNSMRVAREEIFGPVACVIPFESEADALEIGNDADYALAAGVWTSDLSRAHRMAARIRAGVVWVNTYNSTDPAMPFGGVGQSGVGRELGPEGVDAFLETKSVVIRVGDAE
ncbi:aldehyde dehydrogenase family protein [Microbacterium sp.]|uniref:aldehyde dehydrogenase family protein n=1 Tax=Microbacterium sp. TaxID=51671 RepID=UPI002811B6B3|nr:aldehyde dehydrogenase family protein [Microbacterium sp.]